MTRQELLPIAKPILFNTEMVQAILEGRKTVTRRIVKPQPENCAELLTDNLLPETEEAGAGKIYVFSDGTVTSPQYNLGDILYVRETWHKYIKRVGKGESCHLAEFYGYKASIANSEDANKPWKPSIHMPKEAARIFLKIMHVRVERLQRISVQEARTEGVSDTPYKPAQGKFGDDDFDWVERTARENFAELWDSTIKKADLDKYGWEANPFVWVIEFEKVEV